MELAAEASTTDLKASLSQETPSASSMGCGTWLKEALNDWNLAEMLVDFVALEDTALETTGQVRTFPVHI